MDEKASAMGLTSVQLRVLGSVSRLEAAGETEIHQNDLERIEHVTHPAMTKLLQRLEAKGLSSVCPAPGTGGIRRSPARKNPGAWRPDSAAGTRSPARRTRPPASPRRKAAAYATAP